MTAVAAPLGRDVKVMGLVGTAHAASHFFQLALPPLFPILKGEFGVSYAELGLLPSLLYGASGLSQTAAGFLVDRFGARKVLLSGLTLLSLAVLAAGFVTQFWMLMPLAVLAGMGNSVFHPADLSILTSKVSQRRLGRAYGSHTLCGNLGWAAAPVLVIAVAAAADWRTALIVAGSIGLAVTAALLLWGRELSDGIVREAPPADAAATPRAARVAENLRLLFSVTILSCFCYFVFLAMALIGMQTFAVTALQQTYGVPLATATAGLTAFLIGSAAGIAVGGVAADRTDRHDLIAMAGLAAGSVMIAGIGAMLAPASMLLAPLAFAGFVLGITTPSRDMLVRKATPAGSTGRVFGFVYSGLDLGSCLMPLTLGVVMDRGEPRFVFYAISALMLVTILTVVQVRRQARPSVQTA